RTAKAQVLWSLYPHNNTGRQGGLGFARLHYAPVTHPHTVIFINGSLSQLTAKSCPRALLCRYHIQNSTGQSYQEIQGLLYRRLLLPHTDTWTLFTDDISGICQVENLLTAWCAALSSDALKPTHGRSLGDPGEHPASGRYRKPGRLRVRAGSARLSALIPDKIYLTRRQAHELFSAIHLDWIWQKSLYHIARQPTAPFNCIQACHPNQPLEDQASRYLRLFLDTTDRASAATDTVLLARSQGAEYHFKLRSCPLCLACFSCIAQVLPPTKRPTILTLDGGGVRGVVTLGFLTALEERISGSQGLREAFNLNLGTSVGAVIVSEVINLGRPAAVAHANHHNSNTLNKTLQQAFDPTRWLFGPAALLISGVRVALTASQVDNDSLLSLFCNYRSAGYLIISVGTGYAVGEAPMMTEPGRRWLRDRFIDRALQMFLHSLAVNGRRGWQDALDTIPRKAPELNDIRALDSLRDFAYTVPDKLVRAWLAKTFFFKLNGEPEKINRSYCCYGSILCCKFNAPGIICQTKLNYIRARF
ncbi:hypothetical protein KXW29_006751, partial [Aspergillus fumigatus]